MDNFIRKKIVLSLLDNDSKSANEIANEVGVGNRRVDVVLLRDGKPVSGIEVRDTHPVDDEKWDAFEELGFPCIEVGSKDVIDDWECQ